MFSQTYSASRVLRYSPSRSGSACINLIESGTQRPNSGLRPRQKVCYRLRDSTTSSRASWCGAGHRRRHPAVMEVLHARATLQLPTVSSLRWLV